ncbi:MAG: Nif3-like dinuclear metal center hexameric protein [Firmicutes bacterium]|nr:Nif3-like dinuclear metal center hexameric protein [Bacillota bacterium]MCM1401101.1 Nif3-like dinuclear metal center hexameric protein [Bacteroides sp.]MCM1477076.1 Nif3-like dinuclear metal center hexameric protein [Bacteroides sp.]
MKVGHIVNAIEASVPPAFQESYDNTGLIVGNPGNECTGVLVTVDVTEAVVKEAVDNGLNVIVAHHPVIFGGIKRLTGATPQQRAVVEAIKNDVAIYACHTSLDSVSGGVSQRMASKLGLTSIVPLAPAEGKLLKLQVYVPERDVDDVRYALFDAGAGKLGTYDSCSYSVKGEGTFRALPGANPYVGEIGELHTEREECLQVILPRWKRGAVEQALLQVHPYEMPAYEFTAIENDYPNAGLGAVGNLEKAMTVKEFSQLVKECFDSPVVRTNASDLEAPVRRVALCGGSGASFIKRAIAARAQVMLTSDVKYHDFTDYAGRIDILDIGHHESENCSKSIIFDIISEKFPNFAIRYSCADVNPIKYL